MKNFLSLAFSIVSLFISIVLFTTCSKFYSYEGGLVNGNAGTAAYAFISAGNVCTGNVLSGKYYVGAPLTAANTVKLQVNVSKIGSYNVSTNSVNGFKFSASGNFVDTGNQSITMVAVGTPTTEEISTFATPIATNCSFIVPIVKAPIAIASFTLDGAPNACQNPEIDGNYFYDNQLIASNIVIVNVNVSAVGAYNLSTDTVNGIYFSAAGTFTKTGAQTVILKGHGTPLSPSNLTFTPHNNTTSCTFKITVLAPGPPATYVLQSGYGNPNPCLYSVTGDYYSSTALTSTNNVSILVYVTVIGNFSISTNTVNGIQFSYTGVFTSLGSQNVVLYGKGTPAASGTFAFVPQIVGPAPLGGQSCGFNVTIK